MAIRPRTTLAILTALNFLNYIDRSILFAVQPLVQREFGRSDAQIGFLTTAFFICYMVSAPLLGYISDRRPRRPIMITGALVWSAATLLTAVTHSFRALLIRHMIVGIGEASFVAISPGYIADLFPEPKRGRMMSVFFMGIPAGTALGYLVGGFLGYQFSWRHPFYVVAGPGLLLALALLLVREPERGGCDSRDEQVGADAMLRSSGNRNSLTSLFHNRAYWITTIGMALMTFALGGLQVWMPTFLVRLRGLSLLHANLFFAVITAVNGVVATLAGGWFTDRMLRRRQDAYYLVSGAAMAVSVPLMLAAIYVGRPWMFTAILVTEFFLLFNNGPLNTAVVDSVGAGIRATAIAVNLLVIHLLGDSISPTVIGYISDRAHSLQSGFLAAIAAVALASGVLFYGRRYTPQS